MNLMKVQIYFWNVYRRRLASLHSFEDIYNWRRDIQSYRLLYDNIIFIGNNALTYAAILGKIIGTISKIQSIAPDCNSNHAHITSSPSSHRNQVAFERQSLNQAIQAAWRAESFSKRNKSKLYDSWNPV